jgi:Mrp family chromosome partitioning ATPase
MITIPVQNMEIERIYSQLLATDYRSIAVTSCRSGEGVTSLTLALAQRNLLAGRSTLIVDLNLYRPCLIPLLQLEADMNSRSLFKPPQLMTTVSQSLALTGIDTPQGREKLVKLRKPGILEQQIDDWLKSYDTVLLDTSPLGRVNANNLPAERVAAASQATLLVVLSGDTTKAMVSAAKERLESAGAQLAGCVLNDRFNPPLKQELLREIHRITPRFDRLRNRLSRWLNNNRLLSLEV